MANIVFKTRGNSNPQGKSRVYFCAHPKDYGVFFEEISEDILKYQNCAIWYDSEPSADYDKDELMSHLSQMNLFVIPVTYRFLKEDCRARTVEFQYAIDNHIPVLPLMQEDGLDALFNEICGDLQFLYKGAKDDTAISFDEKLEKFLKSVLIGDELAEKIRSAFDAYIFLSYRKKDRKYAQELMRLIHKNDFCRDIAIWYDEFLVPGENFNDLIAKALQKSSLFALAVTPNLVNEENYVMTVEYPEAKKAGKKILPAELVPTDKGELSDKFEGIPDCADAYGVELTDALMRAFEDLAIKENDNYPEHNFFIGLAYLTGIDVEVDHEKAVKLITSAAEAGLPEAMEKLVSMYRNGEGVERNYHTAIEWQRRLVERYKEIYEDTELEGDAFNYLYTLWDLATMENKENTYILFSEIAIKISNNLKKSFKIKRFIHISYRELGGFYKSDEDKTDIAIEYYLKSFELTRQIALERESVLSYRDHAESLKCLGHLYSSLKKYKLAKKYFETTVEFREVILKIDNNTSTIFELVWALEDLATIQQCYGFPQKSIKTLNKAYELINNLLKEYPDNFNYLLIHSLVCSNLCFSYKRCGKHRKRKYIEKMIILENTSISDLEHAFELLPSHDLYDAIVLHYYCASLRFDGEHRLNYLKKARNRCIAYCNEYPESEVVSTILTKTDIEIHELQETLSKQKKKKR